MEWGHDGLFPISRGMDGDMDGGMDDGLPAARG
jgi:hypothetical protein